MVPLTKWVELLEPGSWKHDHLESSASVPAAFVPPKLWLAQSSRKVPLPPHGPRPSRTCEIALGIG